MNRNHYILLTVVCALLWVGLASIVSAQVGPLFVRRA